MCFTKNDHEMIAKRDVENTLKLYSGTTIQCRPCRLWPSKDKRLYMKPHLLKIIISVFAKWRPCWTSKFAEVTFCYVSFPSKLYLTWINFKYCFEFTMTGNTSVKYKSNFLSIKTETHLHEKKHEHGVVRQRLEILLIIDLCSIFFQDQVHLHKVLMALMTCIPDVCQFWNTTV